MKKDPFNLFEEWFKEAEAMESSYPDAFSIATLGLDGFPSTRVVLLKKHDKKSFTFFTNYNSKKSREISRNPKVEFLFHWKSIKKQIRIKGELKKSETSVSDDYWNSRSYESQLNSYISKQSEELTLTKEQIKKIKEKIKQEHPNKIPRPSNWGGFTLTPFNFEFWSDGEFRWHKRELFQLDQSGEWTASLLYP